MKKPSSSPAAKASPSAGSGSYRKSVVREYFETIVIAVILSLFVRTFVFQAFKIPTGSMENNLLIGDHLLVNKFVFAPHLSSLERALLPERPIRRGDIIVFKYPGNPERDFIKRVIGLPGETLEVRAKKVYIDGRPIDEPYVFFLVPPQSGSQMHEVTSEDLRERWGPKTIPTDHYFVMGDNRDNSQDSRYWEFLPKQHVKGRAVLIYWSYESVSEDYQQSGLGATVKDLASVVAHFFTRTRWSRMFQMIH